MSAIINKLYFKDEQPCRFCGGKATHNLKANRQLFFCIPCYHKELEPVYRQRNQTVQ
jgi:hypothetical protein